ncbi:MAG: stage II sporulation protein M [Longimicrobiales bacterium]|nr:stage II sporulation protein M [Longimicrobiales bacterium]
MSPATGAAAPTGFDHLDKARSLQVETPEHVRLGFELAGVGSRAAAVILDLMVLSLAAAAVSIAAALGQLFAGGSWLSNLGATAGIFLLFLIQWGYFFLAEGFFDGRTLGKRWIGLRVIGERGVPLTLQASALRNLLRIVDFQPALSGLLGLGLIALHPRSQRLGDIVAGTVVVRDRGQDEIPEERPAEERAERPLLDQRRFDVLERYVQRRESLPDEIRSRLAGQVAEAMGPAISAHPRRHKETLDQLLLELYQEEKPRQSMADGVSVQAVELVRRQSPRWRRLRSLVDRAGRRGLATLTPDELQEFTILYREVVADLARAHTYGGSLRLCFHLERLAAEAHNLFYRDTRQNPSVLRWLRRDFPSTVRARRHLVAAAAALLFVPALLTYAGVRADPQLGRTFVPVQMITRAEEAGERLAQGQQYVDIPPVQMSVFSSAVMTNNIQVAFTAVAGGILAGLGTLAILVFNGIHLGSVFALYALEGADRLLWIFVLPHGVLELTAIVIAGAAGLCIGRTLVAPGRRTRARALQEEGRTVLSLVAGAAVLLILAGLVEGFVSPARTPDGFKVIFASATAVLLFLYLLVPGTTGTTPDVREGRDA